MSSWMSNEEENQERIRRSDTCQRQERNGEAAHGEVCTRTVNNSNRCANRSGYAVKEQAAVASAPPSAGCKVICALLRRWRQQGESVFGIRGRLLENTDLG